MKKHGQGTGAQDANSLSGAAPVAIYQNTKAATVGKLPFGKPHAKVVAKKPVL